MARKNRRQRREEERRILREFEEAMQESKTEKTFAAKERETPQTVDFASGGQTGKIYGKNAPETLHCRRCRTVMERGVCPVCGYKVYVPMDEQKRKKVRWIVTGVCLVLFVVVFAAVQAMK